MMGTKNLNQIKILPLQKGDPQTIKSWYMQLISVLNQKYSKVQESEDCKRPYLISMLLYKKGTC